MARYILVIGWIGLMKFTAYEAKGIQPLVAHSPLLAWTYQLVSVRQSSEVPSLGGFPALSGGVSQFLLKDVVLCGAAVWSLGDALAAARELPRTRSSCAHSYYSLRNGEIERCGPLAR
jgi:reactive chlorine resistance protein C